MSREDRRKVTAAAEEVWASRPNAVVRIAKQVYPSGRPNSGAASQEGKLDIFPAFAPSERELLPLLKIAVDYGQVKKTFRRAENAADWVAKTALAARRKCRAAEKGQRRLAHIFGTGNHGDSLMRGTEKASESKPNGALN